jgi:hypothetical protein
MLESSLLKGLSLAAAVSSPQLRKTASNLLARSRARWHSIQNSGHSEDSQNQFIETLECLILAEPELLKLLTDPIRSESLTLAAAWDFIKATLGPSSATLPWLQLRKALHNVFEFSEVTPREVKEKLIQESELTISELRGLLGCNLNAFHLAPTDLRQVRLSKRWTELLNNLFGEQSTQSLQSLLALRGDAIPLGNFIQLLPLIKSTENLRLFQLLEKNLLKPKFAALRTLGKQSQHLVAELL